MILKANTSDDSAGEKEAKRQRSEPTTPVSTSGRLPYDYDAVMGITKVGTKEAEGFDEDLDAAEYHDAAEEPIRRDEPDNTVESQRLSDFQGGYGSSSLKECIELLNTTSKIAPAPLDSGAGQKSTDPSHFRPELVFPGHFAVLGHPAPSDDARKGHFLKGGLAQIFLGSRPKRQGGVGTLQNAANSDFRPHPGDPLTRSHFGPPNRKR